MLERNYGKLKYTKNDFVIFEFLTLEFKNMKKEEQKQQRHFFQYKIDS